MPRGFRRRSFGQGDGVHGRRRVDEHIRRHSGATATTAGEATGGESFPSGSSCTFALLGGRYGSLLPTSYTELRRARNMARRQGRARLRDHRAEFAAMGVESLALFGSVARGEEISAA